MLPNLWHLEHSVGESSQKRIVAVESRFDRPVDSEGSACGWVAANHYQLLAFQRQARRHHHRYSLVIKAAVSAHLAIFTGIA